MPRQQFYAALFALHRRLLAGDPATLGDIARLAFEPLIALLRHEYKGQDDHLLQEKAADALLEYGKNPSQANAVAGAGVMGFLVKRARSRVITGLGKERRRLVVEERFARDLEVRGPSDVDRRAGNAVELPLPAREHLSDQPNDKAAAVSDPAEDLDNEARREEVLGGPKNALDQQVLKMMLDGVRATTAYARVLGIEELPPDQQRRIVKQHKDRLKVAAMRRQATKRSGPKRRGRPPRRTDEDRANND